MRRSRVMATLDQARDVVVRRHRPDYQILLYMGLLMLFGLIVMYAIGPQRASLLNGSSANGPYSDTYFFIKQAVSLLIALVAFIAMAMTPLVFIKSHAKQLLYAALGACVLLVVVGNMLHIDSIAHCTLGACRWYDLGPIGTFQPAELLKFALLVFFAGFLSLRLKQGLMNDVEKTLIPAGALYVASLIIVVVFEKDMGTGITLSCIVASIFFVGGLSKKMMMRALMIFAALVLVLIISAPHRISRITTFISGDSASGQITDANFQVANAKIALGSGGLFGLGIGNSVQASGYLPEAINDSVFAIIGEIFGFIGVVVVLGLFTALLMRLLRVANHLSDTWMRILVGGVFGWMASHVIINVAAMIGIFPLTGITLPMISFGGTSMIFIAAALGIAFQLSRYTTHSEEKGRMTYESHSSRRGLGRPRYTGRSSSRKSA